MAGGERGLQHIGAVTAQRFGAASASRPRRISKWSQRARSCPVIGMAAPSGPVRAL
jgi:hypothetical protein